MLDEEQPETDAETDEEEDVDEIPEYWESSLEQRDFEERYDESGRVLKQIQKLFDQTWGNAVTRDRKGGGLPRGLRAISAHRVEDRAMWLSYARSKRRVRRERQGKVGRIPAVKTLVRDPSSRFSEAGLDMDINEYYLFHGTSPEGALGISSEGFRMDLSGSNAGSMFGKGAYFAECCSKGDEYAHEGSGIYRGIYAMLICRVTCGEMFRMLQRDDDAVNTALRSGACDAVLGDREASVGTYREFVVFRRRQIYPEYVVLYKRVHEDSPEESKETLE